MPIPQIEISVYQGTNSNSRDSPSGNTLKDFIEVPEQAGPSALTDQTDSSDSKGQHLEKVTGTIERRANSERKRNVKIASFRSLIESKIFSKSEKELEQIGLGKKSAAAAATDATSCHSQDEIDPVNEQFYFYRKVTTEFSLTQTLVTIHFRNCWEILYKMIKRCCHDRHR